MSAGITNGSSFIQSSPLMKLLPILPALSFLMISCAARLYLPSPAVTTMFDGAGDIEVGGFVGTSGIDLQLAASPIDHVSLALSGSYAPESANDTDYAHYHRYGELALGFYTHNVWPFGREEGESMQLGLMAGAGIGESGSTWFLPFQLTPTGPVPPPAGVDVTLYRMEGSYTRYYIRTLFGYEEPSFSAGMVIGAGWLDYHLRRSVDSLQPPAKGMRHAEFFFFGRYKLDVVELEAQLGVSTGGAVDSTIVDLSGACLSLGARLPLGKFFTDHF